MKRYRAILFDLFGTLALFRQEKLPVFEWRGKTTRSTLGQLRAVVEQQLPNILFADFFAAFTAVSAELHELRSRNMREIASAQRFALILARLGVDDSHETQQIAETLSLAHMELLANATDVPESHLSLLEGIQQEYRVAVVSNFDHAPTARHILLRDGVAVYLQHIIISHEHGWRKPHPRIFVDTLALLDVAPDEALFVGDSPHDDIRGAQGVGMDIAWINAANVILPKEIPPPTYVVRELAELRQVLFS
ncbi:MAG: HAD family hydrolase [Candidatus Binatia bacterium]